MADTFANLDASLAAGTADFDVEHHMLMATNQLIARGFLQLPGGEVLAGRTQPELSGSSP
jgi:hypothetical protein